MDKKQLDDNIGKPGFIYIMTNPCMPEYVKIGYSANVKQREKELSRQTACPLSFCTAATYEVNRYAGDKILHDLIDLVNDNKRTRELKEDTQRMREREFFQMSEEDAFLILENIAEMSGTKNRLTPVSKPAKQIREEEEAEAARKRQSARRENFSFAKCGILKDEEVELVGHPNVKAKVCSDNQVEYEGNPYSLSPLAQKILGKTTLQGPAYWMYKGRILNDIRAELEEKGEYK